MSAELSRPYEAHLLPPKYPTVCFPRRCRHEPKFVTQAAMRIVPQALRHPRRPTQSGDVR
jgi:hypothetical protein